MDRVRQREGTADARGIAGPVLKTKSRCCGKDASPPQNFSLKNGKTQVTRRPPHMGELISADKVAITTILDNMVDVLLPSTDSAKRYVLQRDFFSSDTLVAEHG